MVPSKSNWVCTCFYVNRHFEQKRRNKRFVVDYSPLNEYLKDIKHHIPNKDDLLKRLKGCHTFSKLDLNSGF